MMNASILWLSCLALQGAAETGPGAQPPNVVFILVDDLRWDELSCTGHPFVRTPHADRIAREGARFRNAFATTPLCSPSRGSFLTGQYAHRHGITDNTNRSDQSHRLLSFPRLLQEAGYVTAFIGKWHMGNDESPRPGFSRWACLKGQGTSFSPTLNVDGTRREFHQLFPEGLTVDGESTDHTSDVLNRLAVDFVRMPHQQPFCLYLSHKALHPEATQYDDGSVSDPDVRNFLPAERHREMYAEAPVPRRLNCIANLAGKRALSRQVDDLPPLGPATATDDKTIRDRWRMLAAVDEGVGLLLEALEESGRLDETVFIYTSDHGYWYGEHGLGAERRLAYEEGTRIPLLVRFPPLVRPGLLVEEISLNIDLAPTLLELAGLTPPREIDGRSLLPLLRGEGPADWRKSFLIEYYSDIVFPRTRNMGYQAVRTERFKYIRFRELEGMDELYDLREDPYEMRNVIHEPEFEETLRQLRGELSTLTGEGEGKGEGD